MFKCVYRVVSHSYIVTWFEMASHASQAGLELVMWTRMTLNSWPSCVFTNAGIAGVTPCPIYALLGCNPGLCVYLTGSVPSQPPQQDVLGKNCLVTCKAVREYRQVQPTPMHSQPHSQSSSRISSSSQIVLNSLGSVPETR